MFHINSITQNLSIFLVWNAKKYYKHVQKAKMTKNKYVIAC